MSSNSTSSSPLAFCVIFLTVFMEEPPKVNSGCLSFLSVKELSMPLMSSWIWPICAVWLSTVSVKLFKPVLTSSTDSFVAIMSVLTDNSYFAALSAVSLLTVIESSGLSISIWLPPPPAMSTNSTSSSPLAFCVIFLTVLTAEPSKVNSVCLSFLFDKELSISAISSFVAYVSIMFLPDASCTA